MARPSRRDVFSHYDMTTGRAGHGHTIEKAVANAERPDDLPEEWHNTYDEPSAVNDFEKVFAAVFYTVCAIAFVAIGIGIFAARAAQ